MLGTSLVIALVAGQIVQNPGQLGKGPAQIQHAAVQQTPLAVLPAARESVTPLSAELPGTKLPEIVLPTAPSLPRGVHSYSQDGLNGRIRSHDAHQKAIGHIDAQVNQFGMPCQNTFTAQSEKAGMAALSVQATCRTNQRVEIVHDRLRFAGRLSQTGTFVAQVPALSGNATFLLRFEDGTVLRQTVAVPAAREFERVVLQTGGMNGARLHAYEFGAGFFDDGHVWQGAPRNADFAETGNGGFFKLLGDASIEDPLVAQVYSYPRGESATNNVVRVSIEIEVTAQNCNHQVVAETLQPGADGQLQAATLSVNMPDCSAAGEFLVLKNAVRDLKIASN